MGQNNDYIPITLHWSRRRSVYAYCADRSVVWASDGKNEITTLHQSFSLQRKRRPAKRAHYRRVQLQASLSVAPTTVNCKQEPDLARAKPQEGSRGGRRPQRARFRNRRATCRRHAACIRRRYYAGKRKTFQASFLATPTEKNKR